MPEGDILSGDVQPPSQEAYLNVDVAVTIKNKGAASGHFTLYYYEGAQLLRYQSAGTINPGQTIEDIAEIFIMPDRDFVVTVKLDSNITKDIGGLYERTSSMEDVDFGEVFRIFNQKVRVRFWLEHNPKKAAMLRKRFMKFFGIVQ